MTYLIAHGMAESYVMSGRATPASLLELVHYDHAALTAIRTNAADPSWSGVKQASGAIRALLDYTTTMEAAAAPMSAQRAASR